MTLAELPAWARDLLVSERVAHLAYLDAADRPRVLAVTFALAGDAVWSAIDRKAKRSAEPARVRYLRRRPEAALLVDHYEDDWAALRWVQLRGLVDVLDVAGNEAALDALAAKYPQYGADAPPGPLLRLTVQHSICWRAGQG